MSLWRFKKSNLNNCLTINSLLLGFGLLFNSFNSEAKESFFQLDESRLERSEVKFVRSSQTDTANSTKGVLAVTSDIPYTLIILTTAHAKNFLCQNATTFKLVFSNKEVLEIPCSQYITQPDTEVDTGFVFLKKEAFANFRDLLQLASPMVNSAQYTDKTELKSYCSDSKARSAWSKNNYFYDGKYFQAVTQNIPGCSGAPLYNEKNQIIGVMKGFSLETNRTVYNPLNRAAMEPVLQKVIEVNPQLKLSPVANQKMDRFKVRGNPGDGNPSDFQNSDYQLMVDESLLTTDYIPTFFMLRKPSRVDQISTFAFPYWDSRHNVISCLHSPPTESDIKPLFINEALQFKLNLSSINQGHNQVERGYYYSKQQNKISTFAVKSQQIVFGSTEDDLVKASLPDNTILQIKKGAVWITENQQQTVQLNDPNICHREFIVKNSANEESIYNITTHFVLGNSANNCPYANVIVRKLLPNGDYIYLEVEKRQSKNCQPLLVQSEP